MICGIFLLGLFLSPLVAQAAVIQRAHYNNKGYCYGYFGDTSKWCWLTYEGLHDYATEDGTGTGCKNGCKCKDWDTYSTSDFCEGAAVHKAWSQSHESEHHNSQALSDNTTIERAHYNNKGYCYGYFGDTNKWCWLTYEGHHDYATEDGTGHGCKNGCKCKDWDTYSTLDFCEGAADQKAAETHESEHHDSPGLDDDYYAGWGLQWIVNKNCKAKLPDLVPLICRFYGGSHQHYSWAPSGYHIYCSTGKKVILTGEGTDCWKISGSIPDGGAPKPANPKDPSQLQSFIANWIPNQLGKKVQRFGETNAKRFECWDLAARAIDEANMAGFNLKYGHKGGEVHYVWSDNVVPPTHAKAGDIAQFSYYRQSRHGYSIHTDKLHTALVLHDFDASDCSIDMYDQNPSPVHKTTYFPPGCPGHTSGKMVIYRLESTAGSPWGRLYSVEEVQEDPDDEEPSPMRTPIAVLMIGATAAMAVFGCVAGRLYSARNNGSTRAMYIQADEDEKVEEGVE